MTDVKPTEARIEELRQNPALCSLVSLSVMSDYAPMLQSKGRIILLAEWVVKWLCPSKAQEDIFASDIQTLLISSIEAMERLEPMHYGIPHIIAMAAIDLPALLYILKKSPDATPMLQYLPNFSLECDIREMWETLQKIRPGYFTEEDGPLQVEARTILKKHCEWF